VAVRAARVSAGGALLRVERRGNRLGYPRIGITVPARVGGAVVRNRVRRRLRVVAGQRLASIGGVDLVIVARPPAAAAGSPALGAALDQGLARLGPPS